MKYFYRFLTATAASAFFLTSCVKPLPPVKKEMEVIQKEEISDEVEVQETASSDSSKALVRIGIRIDVQNIGITSKGKIKAKPMGKKPGDEVVWPAGAYMFFVDDEMLVVGGKQTTTEWKLTPVGDDNFLQIKDRSYRGSLIIRVSNKYKVTVINQLSIDDYLKGVLPLEAAASWPIESLRVQAVASRTYLASHLGSHGSQGFDLCSDVHCQVYGGMSREHPQCNEAVDDTRREILVYQGKPISAFFHSNCGGMTERVSRVWGKNDQPYLPRKKCAFGTRDPRYNWTMIYHGQEMLTMLKAKNLVKGSEFMSLKVKEKSPSGRAEFVLVKTDAGTYTLKGNDFRIALNPEKIRSTKWTDLQVLKGGYKFTGTGWGHGVGMCQWGAKGQAEAGRKYREILSYYYPEAKLTLWEHS